MGNEFKLRRASNKDCEAVRRVVSSVLQEYGMSLDCNGTDADLADVESSYFGPGGSFDVLVSKEGEIVGTVGLFSLGGGRCELRKMYLTSPCRGLGLGQQLLRFALAQARRLGFSRVELETASSLVAAIRLYESFGFRPFLSDHMSARCDQAYFLEIKDEPSP
jgi:putative acetyltransferase